MRYSHGQAYYTPAKIERFVVEVECFVNVFNRNSNLDNIDDCIKNFVERLYSIYKCTFPTKNVNSVVRSPWITRDIKYCINKKK